MIPDPRGFNTFAEIGCVVNNEIGISVDSHVISVRRLLAIEAQIITVSCVEAYLEYGSVEGSA